MRAQTILSHNFASLAYGNLRKVKNKENFELLALKEVVVAYEWWSPRGTKYSDLTWKLLVCWKTGR